MKVVFLASAKPGLRWFNFYYSRVFPEGKLKASLQFATMKKILSTSPLIGSQVGNDDARKYSMPRTPFSIIYRVARDRVEILSLIDQRADGQKN